MKQNKEQPFTIPCCGSLLRIDTNEHKETYLQLNCCGSLEVINTKGNKSVQKITIAESKGGLKTQRKLWTAEGYLHKDTNEI